MNRDEAQVRMQEIQRIMERATLWTLLPGTAAVMGGVLVLGGCAASYAMFRSLDFADILTLSFPAQAGFCVMWFTIGVAGHSDRGARHRSSRRSARACPRRYAVHEWPRFR